MAIRLLFFCVCIGLVMLVRDSMQHYMPLSGSMGVPSLWHRYFWGRGLKSSRFHLLELALAQ